MVIRKFKISFNSPVVLTFSIVCFAATLLGILTSGKATDLIFSVYRSPLYEPMTYFRFLGHVFGHQDWNHFIGNITFILLLGPLLEEKYGSKNIALIIIVTAIVTGLSNYIFFPNIQLLGSSGIVFSFILLSSITSIKSGTIPLTFILVATIYITGQIFESIFIQDNVSQLTHILGGGIGAYFGFKMKI